MKHRIEKLMIFLAFVLIALSLVMLLREQVIRRDLENMEGYRIYLEEQIKIEEQKREP